MQENTYAANVWTLGKFYPDGEAWLVAIAGHMHLLGTHITLERTNAAGKTTLLDIPAWDFHWQGSYQLATPIAIRSDDQLTIRCVYDNTEAAPRRRRLRRPDRQTSTGARARRTRCASGT